MTGLDAEMSEVVVQLESAAERITDLAMESLRAAADGEEQAVQRAVAREKQLNRARRSVEKAISLLGSEPPER